MTNKQLILGGFVILGLLVASTVLLIEWANITIIDATRSIHAIGLTFAVLAGGLFAIFKLNIFRTLRPRLNISLDITHRFTDAGRLHIGVVSTLVNSSRIQVNPKVILTHLEILVPGNSKTPSP